MFITVSLALSRGTIEELVAKIKKISISEALSLLQEKGFDRLRLQLREKPKDERIEFLPEGLLLYIDRVENDFAEIYRGEVDDKECLIYPVRNHEGKLVGGLARSEKGRWHKVLWNMRKSEHIYGENCIVREEPIVIVEGPGDVISLRKSGVKNAVALMGINVSDAQVEKLLFLSSKFVFWLDKDQAGAEGMKMIHKKMNGRADIIRYVDPWEYPEIEPHGDAKQVYESCGEEAVQVIVKVAKTWLEYIMEEQCLSMQ